MPSNSPAFHNALIPVGPVNFLVGVDGSWWSYPWNGHALRRRMSKFVYMNNYVRIEEVINILPLLFARKWSRRWFMTFSEVKEWACNLCHKKKEHHGSISVTFCCYHCFAVSQVVLVEKRDRFSRNNVLHLWPFVIQDLRMLGAKKFFGKFCAGSIDHISIRQLQLILLKVSTSLQQTHTM